MTTTAAPPASDAKALDAPKPATIKDMLDALKPEIARILPSYLTPERMVEIYWSTISRNPDLGRCTVPSLLNCLRLSAQLGLELGGPFGYCYPVPYWNAKANGGKGATEAQLIPGYRGLIKLCRDSEQVIDVESRIVYANERFEVSYGTTPAIVHDMKLAERGEPVAAYSVATFKGGHKSFDVMTKAEIMAVRQRSQSGRLRSEEEEKKGKKASGPWVTDEMEMWRKTPLRRHMKYLPLTQKAALAIELEARAEIDDDRLADLIQIPGVVVPPDDHPKAPIATPQRKSATAALAEQVHDEMAAVPAAAPTPDEQWFVDMKAALAEYTTKETLWTWWGQQNFEGKPAHLVTNLTALMNQKLDSLKA